MAVHMRYIELDWTDMQDIAEALIAPSAAELLDALDAGGLDHVLAVAVELRDAAQAIIAGRV